MTKIFSLPLLLIISMGLLAQNAQQRVQRYVYELNSTPDSTDVSRLSTESFFLDVLDGTSLFYAEGKLTKDSLIEALKVQAQSGVRNFNLGSMKMSSFDFIIIKNADNEIIYHEKIGIQSYSITEAAGAFSWKILPGFKDYNGMKAQGAVANYGGREWHVLFTNEIPVMDGPYKFKTLPGFVVKAWDSRNHYIFSFTHSLNTTAFFNTILPPNTLEVTKVQLARVKETAKNRPIESMTQGNVKVLTIQATSDGRNLSPGEVAQARKETAKRNNNPIEIGY